MAAISTFWRDLHMRLFLTCVCVCDIYLLAVSGDEAKRTKQFWYPDFDLKVPNKAVHSYTWHIFELLMEVDLLLCHRVCRDCRHHVTSLPLRAHDNSQPCMALLRVLSSIGRQSSGLELIESFRVLHPNNTWRHVRTGVAVRTPGDCIVLPHWITMRQLYKVVRCALLSPCCDIPLSHFMPWHNESTIARHLTNAKYQDKTWQMLI